MIGVTDQPLAASAATVSITRENVQNEPHSAKPILRLISISIFSYFRFSAAVCRFGRELFAAEIPARPAALSVFLKTAAPFCHSGLLPPSHGRRPSNCRISACRSCPSDVRPCRRRALRAPAPSLSADSAPSPRRLLRPSPAPPFPAGKGRESPFAARGARRKNPRRPAYSPDR